MKEIIKDWAVLIFWLIFASPMIIGLILMTFILLTLDKLHKLCNL